MSILNKCNNVIKMMKKLMIDVNNIINKIKISFFCLLRIGTHLSKLLLRLITLQCSFLINSLLNRLLRSILTLINLNLFYIFTDDETSNCLLLFCVLKLVF